MSSPHYSQANGQAEADVQDTNHLVAKTTMNGNLNDDDFDEGLLGWQSTPHLATNLSPVQIVFGHNRWSLVPTHHQKFSVSWQSETDIRHMEAARSSQLPRKVRLYNNASARSLAPLQIGQIFLIQDVQSKHWTKIGVTVGIGKHHDYHDKLPSGRVWWRNHRYPCLHHNNSLNPATTQPENDRMPHGARNQTPQHRGFGDPKFYRFLLVGAPEAWFPTNT